MTKARCAKITAVCDIIERRLMIAAAIDTV